MKEEYFEFKDPVAGELNSPEYNRNFKQRREALLGLLSHTSEYGGAVAVTMGFELDNYHVNYLQTWGIPQVCR